MHGLLNVQKNVIDHVSHPYTTTRKILSSVYLNLYTLNGKLEYKRFCAERQQEFSNFNLFLIFSRMEF